MPYDGTRQGRREELSRRRYVQAMVAAALGGMAGCGGDGGQTPTPTQEGATPTATETTATDTTPTDTSAPGETATETPTQTASRGDPVEEQISIAIGNVPQQSNLNIWAETVQASGAYWLKELMDADGQNNDQILLSDHTWEMPHVDWLDEITIPTVHKETRLEPPFDMYRTFDDRFTYWDGETPIDAEARERHEYLWHGRDGYIFDSSATFNFEATSQYELHSWRNKGEVEGQNPDPTNQFIMESNQYFYEPPFHPDFVDPYYQRFQDASSQEEAGTVSADLRSHTVTFFDWAEEGWGSGLYRVESSDDVTSNEMVARAREDHPNDHWTIPEMLVQFAETERMSILRDEGEIDIGGGLVQDEGGLWNRSSLPDHIQEIERFLQNGADQLLFNWNNKHLGRLWVRRAIVAAIDWIQVGINGWGAERSAPVQAHTGMHQAASEANFSQEFLDQLYTYPLRSDMDLANEWLSNAGYTKAGGRWVGPDGDELTLLWPYNSAIEDWVGWAQTVQDNLSNLGIGINMTGLNWPAYIDRLSPDNLNYDIAPEWAPGSMNVWDHYHGINAWWTDPLLAGGPSGEFGLPEDAEVDNQGKPLQVEIPTEIGSIDAPEEAGKDPDLPNGEEIDLAYLVNSFRSPEITEEEFQENARKCARYYNYYVPDFVFHQYAWGLVGNVRDFHHPPGQHDANFFGKGFSGDDYHVMGGITQVKYDEDFEPP